MQLLIYIMLFAALCLLWSLIEAQVFRVKRIQLLNDKAANLKIVFLTDIHYGDYYQDKRLERIVERANKLKPDIIIIGGDYLNIEKKDKFNIQTLKQLFLKLSQLESRYGVVSVLGNHEYLFGSHMNLILGEIEKAGIKLLKNDTHVLEKDGKCILIHGVDDFQEGNIDVRRLDIREEKLNILVSHNPDFFEENYTPFDIGLSGHTHGGQVTLFGLYAPVTESKHGQKYVRRINRKNTSIIITSKGLGCSMLPIRFCAVPEIIELTIKNRY